MTNTNNQRNSCTIKDMKKAIKKFGYYFPYIPLHIAGRNKVQTETIKEQITEE